LIAATLPTSEGGVTHELRAFDSLCAAVLRGEPAPWPQEWRTDESLEAIKRRLLFHGIAGLLHERRGLLEEWPEPLLALLRRESLARAMWELRHKQLVAEVIDALHDAGVRSVVLKGTAYAYGLYTSPALRFRGDTDLLVAETSLPAARRTLAGLGWMRPFGEPGRFGPMHYQELWQYYDPAGLTHDIDLHWEVTNSRALRPVLDAAGVLAEACPLPRLSPHALCAEPITALIHRAVNRAVHAQSGYFSLDRMEYDPDRLAWAVDLDLLARSLTPEQWQDLAQRAVASGVAAILEDALLFAQANLGTPVPADVMDSLAGAPADTPAMRFLRSKSNLARFFADLRATRGFAARVTFVLARLFPSPAHMRDKYPGHDALPLWTLYLKRMRDGVAQAIRKAAT